MLRRKRAFGTSVHMAIVAADLLLKGIPFAFEPMSVYAERRLARIVAAVLRMLIEKG